MEKAFFVFPDSINFFLPIHASTLKTSRNSPGSQLFNQTDCILFSRRWKSTILYNRSYRCAETNSPHGSDHVMARAKIRIKRTTRKE